MLVELALEEQFGDRIRGISKKERHWRDKVLQYHRSTAPNRVSKKWDAEDKLNRRRKAAGKLPLTYAWGKFRKLTPDGMSLWSDRKRKAGV